MCMPTGKGPINNECSTFDDGSSDVWATNIQKGWGCKVGAILIGTKCSVLPLNPLKGTLLYK